MVNQRIKQLQEERDRYKKALEGIKVYSPYGGAREMAVRALDLSQDMREMQPITFNTPGA